MEKSPASTSRASGFRFFSSRIALWSLAKPPEFVTEPFCRSLTGSRWSCRSWVKSTVMLFPAPWAEAGFGSTSKVNMKLNRIINVTALYLLFILLTSLFIFIPYIFPRYVTGAYAAMAFKALLLIFPGYSYHSMTLYNFLPYVKKQGLPLFSMFSAACRCPVIQSQ